MSSCHLRIQVSLPLPVWIPFIFRCPAPGWEPHPGLVLDLGDALGLPRERDVRRGVSKCFLPHWESSLLILGRWVFLSRRTLGFCQMLSPPLSGRSRRVPRVPLARRSVLDDCTPSSPRVPGVESACGRAAGCSLLVSRWGFYTYVHKGRWS